MWSCAKLTQNLWVVLKKRLPEYHDQFVEMYRAIQYSAELNHFGAFSNNLVSATNTDQ